MADKLTIDDLLNALKGPKENEKKTLENNANTWSRIGQGDSFTELGLSGSELDDFLTEWIEENGYNNLV